jgi:oligosaccharide repeat unit polymerase
VNELVLYASGAVVILAAQRGFRNTRDPLLPSVFLAPMLLYVYAFHPLTLYNSGSIHAIFPNPDQLVRPNLVNLFGIAFFCWGSNYESKAPVAVDRKFVLFGDDLSPIQRHRIRQVAVLLSIVATFVFLTMVWSSGGIAKVLSQRKPSLQSPIGSGYYNELTKLGYPAMLLLAASRQGRRFDLKIASELLLFGAAPVLHSTMLGRRGPMFMTACTLFACWCIVRGRRPNLRGTILTLGLVGCLMLLLAGNRNALFQPWENEIDFSVLTNKLTTGEISSGDEYVAGVGTIQVSHFHQRHFWGLRLFTQTFIRPIPKQLWPSKYEDMGMGWMTSDPGSAGFKISDWKKAVGFEIQLGSAPGFIADLFLEFSYLFIIPCFLIGWFYAIVWEKATRLGGKWAILYALMLILSVFLIAQSIGAWLYKLLLLWAPCWYIHHLIAPRFRESLASRSAAANIGQGVRT